MTILDHFSYSEYRRFFAKANMSKLHHFSKKLHWLPVKERILFKIYTFALFFSFFFMVPCHHICHPVSLCTLHLILSIPIPTKKTHSCAKWKVEGCNVCQVPLIWNSFLPTSNTVAPSQFKTSLKTFLFTSAFSELPWFPRRFESFISFLIDCWCLCVADLSVRARVTDKRDLGVAGGGGERLSERKGYVIYI